MKLTRYEFVQSAVDGGHPVPNGQGIEHGEPVYVVKKRELLEFALGVQGILRKYNRLTHLQDEEAIVAEIEAKDICNDLLKDDQFVMPLRKLGTPPGEDT